MPCNPLPKHNLAGPKVSLARLARRSCLPPPHRLSLPPSPPNRSARFPLPLRAPPRRANVNALALTARPSPVDCFTPYKQGLCILRGTLRENKGLRTMSTTTYLPKPGEIKAEWHRC